MLSLLLDRRAPGEVERQSAQRLGPGPFAAGFQARRVFAAGGRDQEFQSVLVGVDEEVVVAGRDQFSHRRVRRPDRDDLRVTPATGGAEARHDFAGHDARQGRFAQDQRRVGRFEEFTRGVECQYLNGIALQRRQRGAQDSSRDLVC